VFFLFSCFLVSFFFFFLFVVVGSVVVLCFCFAEGSFPGVGYDLDPFFEPSGFVDLSATN